MLWRLNVECAGVVAMRNLHYLHCRHLCRHALLLQFRHGVLSVPGRPVLDLQRRGRRSLYLPLVPGDARVQHE